MSLFGSSPSPWEPWRCEGFCTGPIVSGSESAVFFCVCVCTGPIVSGSESAVRGFLQDPYCQVANLQCKGFCTGFP